MRAPLDAERLTAFLTAVGRAASGGRLYLTGGATALLEGWRSSTIDVDLRIEPDDDSVMRVLPELKERLDVNVELASPPDFIPELPGWRERSPFVGRFGSLDVHHFDPYSQALAKIERGFDHDLEDVREMIGRGLVDPGEALALFAKIEPELYRYPAIDAADFARRVRQVLQP
ncbi:MAG TPA: DUF6036 family nucleotidyltransferase [Solirubrobacteraceae bacterium]|nr:DUF6036 family nucleotidyltransferase [Solirubrobacteraceae bacterium]